MESSEYAALVQAHAGRSASGEGLISHYRRDWDEEEKAGSHDTAVETPKSATSSRADASSAIANWKRCAASAIISSSPLYVARASGVTPIFIGENAEGQGLLRRAAGPSLGRPPCGFAQGKLKAAVPNLEIDSFPDLSDIF